MTEQMLLDNINKVVGAQTILCSKDMWKLYYRKNREDIKERRKYYKQQLIDLRRITKNI